MFGLPLYIALPWKETDQHDELLEIVIRNRPEFGRAHYPAKVRAVERGSLAAAAPRGMTSVGGKLVSQPAGHSSGAISLSGASTNRRSNDPRMRDGQRVADDVQVVVEQQVDVERPRPPVHDALTLRFLLNAVGSAAAARTGSSGVSSLTTMLRYAP